MTNGHDDLTQWFGAWIQLLYFRHISYQRTETHNLFLRALLLIYTNGESSHVLNGYFASKEEKQPPWPSVSKSIISVRKYQRFELAFVKNLKIPIVISKIKCQKWRSLFWSTISYFKREKKILQAGSQSKFVERDSFSKGRSFKEYLLEVVEYLLIGTASSPGQKSITFISSAGIYFLCKKILIHFFPHIMLINKWILLSLCKCPQHFALTSSVLWINQWCQKPILQTIWKYLENRQKEGFDHERDATYFNSLMDLVYLGRLSVAWKHCLMDRWSHQPYRGDISLILIKLYF